MPRHHPMMAAAVWIRVPSRLPSSCIKLLPRIHPGYAAAPTIRIIIPSSPRPHHCPHHPLPRCHRLSPTRATATASFIICPSHSIPLCLHRPLCLLLLFLVAHRHQRCRYPLPWRAVQIAVSCPASLPLLPLLSINALNRPLLLLPVLLILIIRSRPT